MPAGDTNQRHRDVEGTFQLRVLVASGLFGATIRNYLENLAKRDRDSKTRFESRRGHQPEFLRRIFPLEL